MKCLLLLLLYVLINISLSLPKANAQIDEMCPDSGRCVQNCESIPYIKDSFGFRICDSCPCYINIWYSYRYLGGCCTELCDIRIDTFSINFAGGQPSDCGFWYDQNNHNFLDGATYQEILKQLLAKARTCGCFGGLEIDTFPPTRYKVRINISACRFNYFVNNSGINKYCNPDYTPCCLIEYQIVRTHKDYRDQWKIEIIQNRKGMLDNCDNGNCDDVCQFFTSQYLLQKEIPIISDVFQTDQANDHSIKLNMQLNNKLLKLKCSNTDIITNISIYNTISNNVLRTESGNNEIVIDLSHLPTGLYFLIINIKSTIFFNDYFILFD